MIIVTLSFILLSLANFICIFFLYVYLINSLAHLYFNIYDTNGLLKSSTFIVKCLHSMTISLELALLFSPTVPLFLFLEVISAKVTTSNMVSQ